MHSHMLEHNNPIVPDYIEVFYAPIRDSPVLDTLLIALFLLIIMDIALGVATALKNQEFESHKVREGLWHKMGEVALVIIGMILDAIILSGITFPINPPDGSAVGLICTCLIFMELGSILEIAAKLNSELAVMPVFKQLKQAVQLKIEESKSTEEEDGR